MASKGETSSSVQLPAQRTNNSLSGKIMWLPADRSIPTNVFQSVVDARIYNHPVVIMSNNTSSEGLVEVFLITSFGTRNIAEVHSPRWKHWLDYKPIEPAVHPAFPNHPLRLSPDCQPLDKASYVNTRQTYFVPLEVLRPYRWNDVDPVLDRASVLALKEASAFVDLFDPRTHQSKIDSKVLGLIDKQIQANAPAPHDTIMAAGRGASQPQFPAFHWIGHTSGGHSPHPVSAWSSWSAPRHQGCYASSWRPAAASAY